MIIQACQKLAELTFFSNLEAVTDHTTSLSLLFCMKLLSFFIWLVLVDFSGR